MAVFLGKKMAMGSNDNTIIFTSSRMNPPTPGHLLLIQRLIEEAIKQSVSDVYVILSKSDADNKNPIICTNKVILLEQSRTADDMTTALKRQMTRDMPHLAREIAMVRVHYRCVLPEQPSPFTQVGSLIDEYLRAGKTDLNLFMIVGDDRRDTIDKIADSYYFKNPQINSMNGLVLMREDMESFKEMSEAIMKTIDISTIPQSAFSASFIRNFVKYGLHEKFHQIYAPYLSPDKIDGLYGEMVDGLRKPAAKKVVEKVIPAKYIYPIVRGTEYFEALVLEAESKPKRAKSATAKTPAKKTGKTRKSRGSPSSSESSSDEKA